jgi:hypothetical protein
MGVGILLLIIAAFICLTTKAWRLAIGVCMGILAGLIMFGVIPIGGVS